MESRRFARYLLELHRMSQETRHEIIDGKELKKLQEADEVWKEVLQWILEDKAARVKRSSTGSTDSETVIQSYPICDA